MEAIAKGRMYNTGEYYKLLCSFFDLKGKCRLEYVSIDKRITLMRNLWNNITGYALVMLRKRKLFKHDSFGFFLTSIHLFL